MDCLQRQEQLEVGQSRSRPGHIRTGWTAAPNGTRWIHLPSLPILFLLAAVPTVMLLAGCTWISADPTPTAALEPLVPTPAIGSQVANSAGLPETQVNPSPQPSPGAAPPPLPEPDTQRWRTGVGVQGGKSPAIYAWTEPRPGWYLNWSVGFTKTVWITETAGVSNTLPIRPLLHVPADVDVGMEFAPMVGVKNGELKPALEAIAATARSRPGHTWIIGNEPDVRWQANSTPLEYVRAYHDAYYAIKGADPTAKIAIGGLSQITPLRLAYLGQIWNTYADVYAEEMPVDVWTMHAFVLQEKAGDWGVDMPPGFEDEGKGMLWEIEDHDDLALVKEQIHRMRGWMADHEQKEKPLWITEYGILMPEEYGFDGERVTRFLLDSNELFADLRDPELGFAADDDLLVQRWAWFSSGYAPYPTGNLFTSDGLPTYLMLELSAYLAGVDG